MKFLLCPTIMMMDLHPWFMLNFRLNNTLSVNNRDWIPYTIDSNNTLARGAAIGKNVNNKNHFFRIPSRYALSFNKYGREPRMQHIFRKGNSRPCWTKSHVYYWKTISAENPRLNIWNAIYGKKSTSFNFLLRLILFIGCFSCDIAI